VTLKKFADSIIEKIGGCAVHPVSNVVGGFKKYPSKNTLKDLLEEANKIKEIAHKSLTLFNSFDYPDIFREHVYSALSYENEYAFYQGVGKVMIDLIKSTDNLIDIMLGVVEATDNEWGNK
jgi:coenzyme F420-reducing hydrogenase alpha subunit